MSRNKQHKRLKRRHMEKANIVLENSGRTVRLLLDYTEYQGFLLRNSTTPHKLECSDPVCGGAVYAHKGAHDRRANAGHGYIEEGYSHKPHAAHPDCIFNHSNDRRFEGLEQPDYANKLRGQVRALLEQPKNRALIEGDLRVMLGKKADIEQHFTNLVEEVCDNPVLLTRPRIAAALYVPKIKPFVHTYPNHATTLVQFMEEEQQRTTHSHGTRIALVPKNVTLVRVDNLKPIYDRSFEVDVSHGATDIVRHSRSQRERAFFDKKDRARSIPPTLQMRLALRA